MRIFNKTSVIIATAAMLTSATSCKKLLEEQPRAQLYPEYFTTSGGVQAAVTGVYNDLRGAFSGEGLVFYYSGTDENIPGGSAGGASVFNTYSGINSSNGPNIMGLYIDINTLNGVFQYATAITNVNERTQFVAQAKFLRAFMYFYLVQTYGGTTATQKSGIPLHTTYLTQASTEDKPAPLADIYNLIIKDLTEASNELPNTIPTTSPFSAGGVGKTATAAVAKAYLAKAYLTRAYSEAKQAGDFQQAADLTAGLITNKGTYGLDLWQDFSDVHKPANDYGKENMFAIDYGGASDPQYTGYTLQGSGGYGINQIYVLARMNYQGPGIDNIAGIDAVPQKLSAKSAMLRDVYNGRPYTRIAPNVRYSINTAFADQVHDSRYENTFQTFWICNTNVPAGTKSDGSLKGKLIPTSSFSTSVFIRPIDGDTSILMPGTDVDMVRRDAFKGLIVAPKQYNNVIFPTVKKFDDPKRTGTGDFSSRPIVLMRFSEVYLMNAEANYMLGNAGAAAASLNVLRRRAAYRTPEDGQVISKSQISVTAANMTAVNAANATAMTLTPAQEALLSIPNNTTSTTSACGMDLILEEYTRELYGDPRRWYDLVRTQQLVRRNQIYNTAGGANIRDFHTRWPIPQDLINSVLTGPKYPQNNGY
jgi:hypothetical protein